MSKYLIVKELQRGIENTTNTTGPVSQGVVMGQILANQTTIMKALLHLLSE